MQADDILDVVGLGRAKPLAPILQVALYCPWHRASLHSPPSPMLDAVFLGFASRSHEIPVACIAITLFPQLCSEVGLLQDPPSDMPGKVELQHTVLAGKCLDR